MRALGVSRGNITMILEVAILNIRPGESADFESAFAKAQAIIAARPDYAPVRARRSQYNRFISLAGSSP
jgi:hypothetical protein